MPEQLPDDALLAWGLDWQRHLESGAGGGYHVPTPTLLQYLTKANELLAARQRQPQARGGRPPGTSMGAEAANLIANCVREDAALRMIARRHSNTVAKVRDSLRRHRAGQSRT